MGFIVVFLQCFSASPFSTPASCGAIRCANRWVSIGPSVAVTTKRGLSSTILQSAVATAMLELGNDRRNEFPDYQCGYDRQHER